MEKLDSVLFYYIEKAIKSYRQFAQRELKNAGLIITVDQWLTLNYLNENPQITQKELAEAIFKNKQIGYDLNVEKDNPEGWKMLNEFMMVNYDRLVALKILASLSLLQLNRFFIYMIKMTPPVKQNLFHVETSPD